MGIKMPEINEVIVSGRLTGDPELRYTHNSMAYAKFCIANTRRSKEKEETMFLSCIAWAGLAESMPRFCAKGMGVVVQGFLKQEKWEKDGQQRERIVLVANRVHSLEWLDEKPAQAPPSTTPPVDDDDVPF